jgi:CheY-like chemotaxis protein
MPPTSIQSALILNVGRDPVLLNTRRLLLESAGYLVESACSTKDAINQFRSGDLDLVVLCHSVPEEERDYFIGLIRDYGSLIPVIFVAANSQPYSRDGFADLSTGSEPANLLRGVNNVLQHNRHGWD